MAKRKEKERKVEWKVRGIGEKVKEKSEKKHIEMHRKTANKGKINIDNQMIGEISKHQEEGWQLLSGKNIAALLCSALLHSLEWFYKISRKEQQHYGRHGIILLINDVNKIP